MRAKLLFEPRDLWIGVYWKTFWEGPYHTLIIYLCLLPLFPLRFSFRIGSVLTSRSSGIRPNGTTTYAKPGWHKSGNEYTKNP